MADKFKSLWLSHTSINTFTSCPRAYYLGWIYRDPITNKKIKVTAPALALGQAVHSVLESIATLPTELRFSESLLTRLDFEWEKVSGKKGGFFSMELERHFKDRAREMLLSVEADPKILTNKALKFDKDLPYYFISEEEEIILCGKVDWMEYLPEADSIHIVDFKTGKTQVSDESLQLAIYFLLVSNLKTRPVTKVSYWYLENGGGLVEQQLPDLDKKREEILSVGKQIKDAKLFNSFKCPTNGCRVCRDFERIVAGEGEWVGNDQYGNMNFAIPYQTPEEAPAEDLPF